MRISAVLAAAAAASTAVVGVLAVPGVPPAAPVAPPTVVSPTAGSRVAYRPPVDATVIDGFRPPGTPWGPGNRGVDYATRPGGAVRAAADGIVSFAGQVGGTLHVTISHADGVRTSYSFLGSIAVRRGESVRQGQRIASAGERPLHFGARRGTVYIDPRSLFTTGPVRVHLVPTRRR